MGFYFIHRKIICFHSMQRNIIGLYSILIFTILFIYELLTHSWVEESLSDRTDINNAYALPFHTCTLLSVGV